MMDETILYEPNGQGPRGGAPRDKQRYTFGSGARPLEGYTIKRAIGRGGFGEVYYAVSDAGKEVALKLILRNHDVERRGVVQCMNLKSPHLITVYDLKETDEGDAFVIMEFVNGPSLESILRQHPTGLPLNEVRTWLKGLVDGVAYLHDHGIVHRDLKPANLFLEEGVVKIGDYGLSKAMNTSGLPGHSESVGTVHYMAPEISSGKYHKPIDVYALGIIVYEMITGRVPFDGETPGEVLMKHLTSRVDLAPLPEPYRSIVARAVSKDPNHRPQRVTDLLLPGDARKEPEVRFLGDGKAAPSDPGPPAPPPGIDLVIPAEETVMYIGPETRPPRNPQAGRPRPRPANFHQWLWGAVPITRAVQARRAARPAPAPPAPPRPAPVPARRVARPAPPPRPAPVAVEPPAPPPPAPPLPSPRVRVAELAGSMIAATPLALGCAVPTLLAFDGFGEAGPKDPVQLFYLFSLILLGSWGVLGLGKLWEGRAVSGMVKRLFGLGLGLLLGVAGMGLADWLQIAPPTGGLPPALRHELADFRGASRAVVAPLTFAAYFGLAFALNGWWKLTGRERPARIRPIPVGLAALIGYGLSMPWPNSQPWGLIVVASVAAIVQFVSPWSRAAATYARYVARNPRAA